MLPCDADGCARATLRWPARRHTKPAQSALWRYPPPATSRYFTVRAASTTAVSPRRAPGPNGVRDGKQRLLQFGDHVIVALGAGMEAQLPLLLSDDIQIDPQRFERQDRDDAFRPFEDQRAFRQHRIEIELSRFASGLDAVGVHVKKPGPVGTPIFVHQHKRRAGDHIQRTPSLCHSLHERGLARAEFTLQTNQITGLK